MRVGQEGQEGQLPQQARALSRPLYLDDVINGVEIVACSPLMSTNGFSTQIIKMVGARDMSTNGGIQDGSAPALNGGANAVNNTAARAPCSNMGQTTGKQVNARLKGKEAVADSYCLPFAKHLPAGHKKRPAAYLKLQVGKKGVKQKTAAAPASNNPDWGKTITLTPITDLEEDLRIQVYDRRMFAEDDQLGQTLKIPLRDLIDNASVEKWYDIEPTADKPLKEGEKSAQIKLSIELHGVKAGSHADS